MTYFICFGISILYLLIYDTDCSMSMLYFKLTSYMMWWYEYFWGVRSHQIQSNDTYELWMILTVSLRERKNCSKQAIIPLELYLRNAHWSSQFLYSNLLSVYFNYNGKFFVHMLLSTKYYLLDQHDFEFIWQEMESSCWNSFNSIKKKKKKRQILKNSSLIGIMCIL